MPRRTELRESRADDRVDRRYAERLWAAAARGDRVAFDRIFETWLAKSYESAWHACHDRCAAQTRARTLMLQAVASSAEARAPSPRLRR